MFGLSQHPFSRVCHHSNPASVTSHRSWSTPVSTQSDFAVFPHENVCQPSSLQSKLRSIKTRLNWLQTAIDGQKSRRILDEMSKSHRSRLDTSFCTRSSGSSQLARHNIVEHIMYWSRVALQTNTERGSVVRDVPFVYTTFLRHTVQMTSVSTPSSAFSAGGSEANVTSERQRLHGEGIAEVEGRKPQKKKLTPQTTIVYNTVYNSGAASSATISSGTPVHREISTPPTLRVFPITRRWRVFVVNILQTERIRDGKML